MTVAVVGVMPVVAVVAVVAVAVIVDWCTAKLCDSAATICYGGQVRNSVVCAINCSTSCSTNLYVDI